MLRLGLHTFVQETWQEVRELRRQVELGGIPDDPEDIRYQFVNFVKNAENLKLLFGGTPDESSRKEAFALFRAIKAARFDNTPEIPTHVSPSRYQ